MKNGSGQENRTSLRVDEKWREFDRADWLTKLGLMRHGFSMHIDRVDGVWEDVHIVLDERRRQDYRVAKPMGYSTGSSVMAFVRFLFGLGEKETKRFSWSAVWGTQTWLLSRKYSALYVEAPGVEEGFFIRYRDFREACLAALEQQYGWGYGAETVRIEVPERDLETLTWTEPEDVFELVRYLDDGRSFETTDPERLLQYVEKRRSGEKASDDPDPDLIRRYNDLLESVRFYLSEKKCLKRPRKLSPVTNVSFSQLKDNWERCDFSYDVSMKQNDRHDAEYRRYGNLPGGSHFGVYIWPHSDPWPKMSVMVIVGKDGEMQTNSVIDDRWDAATKDRWPLAAVKSPSGRTIVWLKDGKITSWRMDMKEKRFWGDETECLTDRLDGIPVQDAVMREDGILLMFMENGNVMGYLCDADMVLYRWEDGWIPKTEEHRALSEAVRAGALDTCPDELYVMVCEDDGWGEYDGCGVKRVFFHPGLERIEGTVLANNPGIEKIVIPAHVKYVEWGAFLDCVNLRGLVIDGDPARVAKWDEGAFSGCPCEEDYLRIRNAGGQDPQHQ